MEVMTNIKNRLTSKFDSGKKNLLNIYFTAGYPQLNDTMSILKALENAGADMVEIGMPYSDPLADGPTIQDSSTVALENGMTLKVLIQQLKDLRKEVSVPVLLMGYLNPVMQYGVEQFCKDIAEVGVDGLIIPDLPLDDYEANYKQVFEKYQLSNIFLVTPHTSEARIRKIDEVSSGFIYVVSSDSTTGNAKTINGAKAYFERIQSLGLKTPTMIGFNIKDKETYQFACKHASGAIIGSAFIKALNNSADVTKTSTDFVKNIIN